MRQKWAVLAIVLLALALFGNQMLAARMTETTSLTANPDDAVGLAEAMTTQQTAAAADDSTDSSATTPQVLEHVVVQGETLSGIAAKYGTNTATLKSVNNISDERSLRVGQKLQVLTVSGVLHKIVSGDTLWDIARAYGVALTTIYQANPGLNNTALKLGQKLIVPGGKAVVQQRQVVASRGSTASRGSSSSSSSSSQGSSLGFNWPLRGTITSRFGQRWGKLHAALDIGVPTGTTVKAAASGKVTYAGWATSYGYLVKITHSNGYETRYGHNSQLLVSVGQQVSKGQAIARSGSTGYSTGPHLHFEVRKNGTATNPLNVLP